MKHRNIALALGFCLLGAQLPAVGTTVQAAEAYPFVTNCPYIYEQLTPQGQELYDNMYKTCLEIDTSAETLSETDDITYDVSMSDAEMEDVVTIFMYDHPEFFWMSNRWSYGYYRGSNYVQLHIYDCYQDGSARLAAREEIIDTAQGYIDEALTYSTDYDRAKSIHDSLSEDIAYVEGDLDQSLTSALLMKETVCAGYTKAYNLIANAAGVDTISLLGIGHGWNASLIGEHWYHVDVTNELFLYCNADIAKIDERMGKFTITYSDGTEETAYMHDYDYSYYTDIMPDMDYAYDGSYRELSAEPVVPTEPVTEPPTEPITEPPTEPEPIPEYDPVPEGLCNTALRSVTEDDHIAADTVSDQTGYNIFTYVDELQEVQDSAGNLYAVCAAEDGAVLTSRNGETIFIPQSGYTFGAAAIDDDDNLYILWGRTLDTSVDADDNILVGKYTLSGDLLDTCPILSDITEAQYPFDGGNADICYKDGVLGCLYDVQWTSGHQGSEFTFIDTENMTILDHSDWEGSHSLGVTMTNYSEGFAAVQRGDVYERGLNLTVYPAASPEDVGFTELSYDGGYTLMHSSGTYGESGSHQNDTHLYLGGLAANNLVFALAGKAERGYTSGNYAESDVATEKFDVFVRLISQDLEEGMEGLNGVDRLDAATGEVADQNVVWLTKVDETNDAGQVKIVAMPDGAFCVLWEAFVNGHFDSVRYVILDQKGNILRPESKIANARLSNTSIQPIVNGRTLYWATGEEGAVTWYEVALDAFAEPEETTTTTTETTTTTTETTTTTTTYTTSETTTTTTYTTPETTTTTTYTTPETTTTTTYTTAETTTTTTYTTPETTTTTPETQPQSVSGDVNGDGVLTTDDVSMLLTEISGQMFGISYFTDQQFAAADYNQDGVLTVDDASAFLMEIAMSMF